MPSPTHSTPALVGLDFETANHLRNSACQIGVAVLEGGRLTETLCSYLQPPGPFSRFCVEVHGITPTKVRGAPTLAALWPRVLALLGRGRIFAHNASFDSRVLVETLRHHGITPPPLAIECTLRLARQSLPGLRDYQLPTVCTALGIPFVGHHDALADAAAAARVAARLVSETSRETAPLPLVM